MSDAANPIPQAAPVAPVAAAEPAVAAPAVEAPAPDQSAAAMRQALLRAQVAQVLGPVPAPWVLDAAIAQAKPDLLSDFSGLTAPSRERVSAWKAENAFAFAAAAAATQAPSQSTPATPAPGVAMQQQPQRPAEPLPATPASATSATGGLSADDLRRLSAVHVNPNTITSHPDWSRTRAFWGIA